MFISKDSLVINGISMGQYLTNVKYGFFDTWSSDTGYTLSNKFTGTFKGTVPKFSLSFRPLKPSEITYLTNNIFRRVIQTVAYDDPDGTRKTVTTHKGDLELDYYHIDMSKPFGFELVGNEAL